jgi:hypothetical protein
MANSVMGALAAAMRSLGEDVSYEYLMGLSGSAFRLQFHEEWCPSSPHPFCGVETFQGAVNALPYNLVRHEVKKDDPAAVKKIRAAVKASIDRGMPVLYGSEEEGLIVGYQKGDEEWLCVHPYRFQEGRFVEAKLPWEVRILSGKRTPPSRLTSLRESLAGAVKLAETKDSAGKYACGFNAWEQWIQGLRDNKLFEKANAATLRGMMQGNFWIYESLVDARTAAAAYLRQAAKEFEGQIGRKSAEHLLRVAGAYAEMVEKVLTRKCPLEIAPPPPDAKSDPNWTKEMRAEEAAILEKALELERRAVAEIQAALAAM